MRAQNTGIEMYTYVLPGDLWYLLITQIDALPGAWIDRLNTNWNSLVFADECQFYLHRNLLKVWRNKSSQRNVPYLVLAGECLVPVLSSRGFSCHNHDSFHAAERYCRDIAMYYAKVCREPLTLCTLMDSS